MIEQFATSLASFFCEKQAYDRERIPVYKYGFEVFLSTVINFMVLFVVADYTHTIVGVVFFCLSFVPLRLTAGGYHANHHWSCILGFQIIYLLSVVIAYLLPDDGQLHYLIGAMVLSFIIVWIMAPVEARNKPLKVKQYRAQKRKSRLLICSMATILCVTLLFQSQGVLIVPLEWIIFYVSGSLAAGLTLVFGRFAE